MAVDSKQAFKKIKQPDGSTLYTDGNDLPDDPRAREFLQAVLDGKIEKACEIVRNVKDLFDFDFREGLAVAAKNGMTDIFDAVIEGANQGRHLSAQNLYDAIENGHEETAERIAGRLIVCRGFNPGQKTIGDKAYALAGEKGMTAVVIAIEQGNLRHSDPVPQP